MNPILLFFNYTCLFWAFSTRLRQTYDIGSAACNQLTRERIVSPLANSPSISDLRNVTDVDSHSIPSLPFICQFESQCFHNVWGLWTLTVSLILLDNSYCAYGTWGMQGYAGVRRVRRVRRGTQGMQGTWGAQGRWGTQGMQDTQGSYSHLKLSPQFWTYHQLCQS